MKLIFGCKIVPHPEKGFWATCRDVPEAMTSGRTEEVARYKMEKAIKVALDFYEEKGKPRPEPTAVRLWDQEQPIEVEI